MPRPTEGTFQPYTIAYISKVKEEDIAGAFRSQQQMINDFFEAIPEEKTDYAYAPGKWTLKEMLQHIIDAERIFAYRALSIARGETQNLPGFEEDDYAANSDAGNRSWKELIEELTLVRRTTEILFSSFSAEALMQVGSSNNFRVTPNSIGFILIGHLYHHAGIIQERYLTQ
jgi:uncharacterized damage-inducible protein DinB